MVGGRVMVVVCVWVVSRSSSHRVGARRGQQKCGLAGAGSLALGATADRDSLGLRETAGGNTRGIERNRVHKHVAYLGEQSPNKTTTCNNTHQHRSATARSRSRGAASRTHVH